MVPNQFIEIKITVFGYVWCLTGNILHFCPVSQSILRQELLDLVLMNQSIVPSPPWCVCGFNFFMSAFPWFPDLHINGHNLVPALWFSVSKIYSFFC